jgi:Xaa-Pro aminopeptidase
MDINEALTFRRAAAAAAWGLTDEVVLAGAGSPIPFPQRGEQTYPFTPQPDFYYLTDRVRPGEVVAFDPTEGWVDFLAPVTEGEQLWSGASVPDADEAGTSVEQLDGWLAARQRRPIAWLGKGESDLAERLTLQLAAVRRRKDQLELARMRIAQEATKAAFAAAVPHLEVGRTERYVQIELERAAFHAGADGMAYGTIVGGGENSAVLHFEPSDRPLKHGDLVLIDAGAEYRGYASDVTRTYAVGGQLAGQQREIYDVVRSAQQAGIAAAKPGVEWSDVHLAATMVIAEGLLACGILRGGDPATLVESGAPILFFPHGIGHLVGLGIRDAGGVLYERRNAPAPSSTLRISLPLESGVVVTVEPGVYFVPAILNDPERRSRHREHVDWSKVDGLHGFGGVRIEDNVLITETGNDIITADIPLLG